MNARIALTLLACVSGLLGIACGTSGDGAGESGSPVGDAGKDAHMGSASPDASPDAGEKPGMDGGSSTDAPGPGLDAPNDARDATSDVGGDGGLQPFKGVANSACGDLTRLGVAWWYNWTLSPSGCTSAPFVPMIWGHTGTEQSPAGITGEVSGIVSAGYTYVLGFNEPDNTGQSNISVATAISLWPSFDNPALRIGSPATQGNGTGLTWIQNFMTQVDADTTRTLRVDFIATHWYGWNAGSCDANAANLESWIEGIEAIPGNRPIWITEWGCLNDSNPNPATVQAFYSGAITMFAKHPRLERYAWYPWETNNELVNADGGALTSLGIVFAAAPAVR